MTRVYISDHGDELETKETAVYSWAEFKLAFKARGEPLQ